MQAHSKLLSSMMVQCILPKVFSKLVTFFWLFYSTLYCCNNPIDIWMTVALARWIKHWWNRFVSGFSASECETLPAPFDSDRKTLICNIIKAWILFNLAISNQSCVCLRTTPSILLTRIAWLVGLASNWKLLLKDTWWYWNRDTKIITMLKAVIKTFLLLWTQRL